MSPGWQQSPPEMHARPPVQQSTVPPQPLSWPQPALPKSAHVLGTHATQALFMQLWPDGQVKVHEEPVLVRVHSECLTGDVFGSSRCDCGDQLSVAMQMIENEGKGVLLYLRQEGRGIGLANKLHFGVPAPEIGAATYPALTGAKPSAISR